MAIDIPIRLDDMMTGSLLKINASISSVISSMNGVGSASASSFGMSKSSIASANTELSTMNKTLEGTSSAAKTAEGSSTSFLTNLKNRITGSRSEMTGGMKKAFGDSDKVGASSGSAIAGKLKGAIAAAGIGTVIYKGLSAAISEGAKLQQSTGGIETLFKGSAGQVEKYASQAYRTAGLSANAYMENVTSFSASLLQSLGGNTAKAATQANTAMTDMSDNSNKMGTSMQSIQDAYQGFAKQNYTMLDNLKLGYGGTKTEMERLLSDAGKISGQKYDISNLSDVYSAIHVIQGDLKITGTTAKEASTTFTGSFAAMKGAAQNLAGNIALGKNIGPSLKALTGTTSTFLFNNLLPMIGNIVKAFPGAIVQFIISGFPMVTKRLNTLAKSISGSSGTKMMNSLGASIKKNFPVVLKVIGQLGIALLKVIGLLGIKLVKAGFTLMKKLALGISNGMGLPNSRIGKLFKSIKTIFGGLITFISGVFTGNWSKAWNGVISIFKGIWSGLGAIVKTPLNAVISLVNAAIGGINKISLNIPKWVPKYGGKTLGFNVTKIPMLATGTKNFAGGTAIVGERGPEMLNLPRGTQVHSNAESRRMGSTKKIVINKMADTIVVREDADIDKIASKVADEIEAREDDVA